MINLLANEWKVIAYLLKYKENMHILQTIYNN